MNLQNALEWSLDTTCAFPKITLHYKAWGTPSHSNKINGERISPCLRSQEKLERKLKYYSFTAKPINQTLLFGI